MPTLQTGTVHANGLKFRYLSMGEGPPCAYTAFQIMPTPFVFSSQLSPRPAIVPSHLFYVAMRQQKCLSTVRTKQRLWRRTLWR